MEAGFAGEGIAIARELLSRFSALRDEELDRVTSLFRALIDRDEQTFLAELARIHPGERQRIVAVTQLSKFAHKIRFQPEGYGFDLMHSDEVASRFSEEEIETLWSGLRRSMRSCRQKQISLHPVFSHSR